MRNFHFVLSLNVGNPTVQDFLDQTGLLATADSLVGLRIRSKHFLNFAEASMHAHSDFSKKLSTLFHDQDDHAIKVVTVMNPAYVISFADYQDVTNLEQYMRWDDDCCAAIFFSEVDDEDDESELPKDWLVKYEIFVTEDEIELKNGDHAFDPVDVAPQSFSSAYH